MCTAAGDGGDSNRSGQNARRPGVTGSRPASSGDLGGWDSSTHGGGGGSSSGFEAGGSALQRSVSRLFQERVQYFGGVTFHHGSILAGVLLGQGPECYSLAARAYCRWAAQAVACPKRAEPPLRQHRSRRTSWLSAVVIFFECPFPDAALTCLVMRCHPLVGALVMLKRGNAGLLPSPCTLCRP